MALTEKVKSPITNIDKWKNQQKGILVIYFYMVITKQNKISVDINPVHIPSSPSTYLLERVIPKNCILIVFIIHIIFVYSYFHFRSDFYLVVYPFSPAKTDLSLMM